MNHISTIDHAYNVRFRFKILISKIAVIVNSNCHELIIIIFQIIDLSLFLLILDLLTNYKFNKFSS